MASNVRFLDQVPVSAYGNSSVLTINTGSFMVTGSVDGSNLLTFTKADGSTFNLQVAASASSADSLTTASISGQILTFTKGDATTFPITIPSGGSIATGSLLTTGSVSLSPTLFDKHLKVELNAKGMYTENKFADRGAIGGAVSFDPTQAAYDDNSQYGGYFAWLDAGTGNQNNLAPTNPLALLNLIDDTAEVRRFVGNVKFDYKIHGFEDFTASVNLGYDTSNSHGRKVTSASIPTSDATFNGSLTSYVQNSDNKVFDAYLTYQKTFNKAHNLTVVGGC